MTYKTHINFGITFFLLIIIISKYFLVDIPIWTLIDFFLIMVVMSLIPDMDFNKSFLTNKIGPIFISLILLYIIFKTGYVILILLVIWFLLARIMKHRTITHSIPGVILFCIPFINSIYIIPVLMGYLSHLMADMLTNRGVKLFYPLSKRKFKILNITTGEKEERRFKILIKIVNFCLVIYIFYLYLK